MRKSPGSFAAACISALLSAGNVLPQQPIQAPGDPIARVQSQLVQMYVTVTEGSRRISDIKSSDFLLSEDGTRREIDRVDSETVPLHITLLLDTSGSMRDTLAVTQEAAVNFIDSLQPADRVTLIPFSSDIRLIPQLTEDRAPIMSAIHAAQARGGTKLYDALLLAMKHLNGVEGRRAIVLFSDGEDTARISSLEVVMNAAARHGFPIYTIAARSAMRNEYMRRVLRQLAEINHGKMFLVDDPSELRAAFHNVSQELRAIYVLNYYTDVPQDGRWHDVQISLPNPRMRIHGRRGFFARTGGNGSVLAEGGERLKIHGLGAPSDLLVQDGIARDAIRELMQSGEAAQEGHERPLRLPALPRRPDSSAAEPPVFRVEARFVEVPVLVESAGDRESPDLNEKDFRVYEDDQLREIAFFSREVGTRGIEEPRARATKKLNSTAGVQAPITISTDSQALRLGRYYLVLDDMLTSSSNFLQAKKAAEKIVRDFQDPLRPMSVHLLSESTAEILPAATVEESIEKIRKAVSRASRDVASNDGILNVHEAYLIDRGDQQALELAELRYASDIGAQFRNELGTIDGNPGTEPEIIRSMVLNVATGLLVSNQAQTTRFLDGLRAVVNAASADPATCPKDVIIISSGLVLGRRSRRADTSPMLQDIIAEAKRGKTRMHSIDASGLDVDEPLGINARGAFLVNNPHLMSILTAHAHDWRMERQSPLSQLAAETGGRFLHSTNDLAAAGDRLIRTRGRLYYLGFISRQTADGLYHSVRVSVSQPKARVYSRRGYFAGRHSEAEGPAESPSGESWEALLARANAARAGGDMKGLAAALEPLTRRFTDQPQLWYSLGAAHFKLGNFERAVGALQQAFALSPADRAIGLSLSRAFVAAGYRSAAAETLRLMARRLPQDIELLMDLGRAYESNSRIDDAYQVYRHILDLKLTPPPDIYLLLTRTASRLGHHVEAEIFVNDYLSLGIRGLTVAIP